MEAHIIISESDAVKEMLAGSRERARALVDDLRSSDAETLISRLGLAVVSNCAACEVSYDEEN